MTAAGDVLHARLADASMLMALLKAVNFASFATVSISASGLEVVSEMNQTVQAHAYLYASIFDEYTFTPPENWHEFGRTQEESDEEEDTQPYICFEVNASTIVQCLGLFESRMGNATSREGLADVARRRGEYVEIVYRAVGEPLCLRMHTGRLEMGFRLRTLDSSLTPSLQFSPDDTVAQVIMKELDAGGETRVQVRFSPSNPARSGQGTLLLNTEGSYGSTEISFSHESQVTEKFDCVAAADHGYPLQCVGYMLQASKSSIKTSLRVDEQGMLSAQFMIASHRVPAAVPRTAPPLSVASSGHAFVEFLVGVSTNAVLSAERIIPRYPT